LISTWQFASVALCCFFFVRAFHGAPVFFSHGDPAEWARAKERERERDRDGAGGGVKGKRRAAVSPALRHSVAHILARAWPLTAANVVGHMLTSTSLLLSPVSFVHTIKATAPVWTVVFAHFWLRETFSLPVVSSLIPIVAGTVLCTLTEVDFSLPGALTALAATLVFCGQNIYTKKVFRDERIDHVVLLMCSSGLATVLNGIPLLFWDGPRLFAPNGVIWEPQVWKLLGTMGLCHFFQSIAAFTVLSFVSPLTYAIGNTVKRLFVICFSILWFGNYVSAANAAGIFITLLGVALYNFARARRQRRILTQRAVDMV
jgi:solute carrier family 35 protein E1